MPRLARTVVTLVVLALVMIGCGDGGGDSAADPTACTEGQVDGDLQLYNWSDYMDPALLEGFQEEFGVAATETTYDSNEAMLAQLQAGVLYDVIVPSDYMVGIMIEQGLLNEINTQAVPNMANLAERFTELPYDPGPVYSAAYLYGTTGLGVNKTIVGEDFPHSWALIFDPELTTGFAGGVSVLNDPREAMGAALEYLGYSLNDTDLEHLQEAADVITAAKDGIATFDSDQYSESLANGQVAVAHGYSGNMITDISNAPNPDDFVYILPEEGATLWIDNMVVPTTAEHPCTAFTFINYMLEAENAAALSNYIAYGSPNAAALEFVDPEVVEFYAGTDSANLEVIEDQGDYEINYTDYFAIAKG
jgi:spermidine/putrescine-binding protein